MGLLSFKKAILAPMAGVGDYPFRQTVRRFGTELLYGEMVASEALIRGHKETEKLATCHSEEQPVIVQLMGANPESMAEAAKIIEQKGTQWVDVNMGCPVKKIVGNNSGSALMRDLPLATEIIRRVVKAVKTKVSVKMRLGWDASSVNVLELAKIAQEEGAAYVTVHGRTKSQMYSGVANWDMIKKVKDSLTIPVVGNGDIDSPEIAARRIAESGVDAVMVGRAMMGRPWLLSQIDGYLETGKLKTDPDIRTIKETMLFHLDGIVDYYGERAGNLISRKHVCWYAIGIPGARDFRGRINKASSSKEMKSIIEEFFPAD